MAGTSSSRSPKSRELTHLFILTFSLATIAVLYLAKTVVVPLALAILFAFLLSPLVTLLECIHSGDLAKAAKVITGDEGNPICVTLAEVVERVSFRDSSGKPERKTDAAVAEARV